jgi:hypothetical protein
MAKKVEMSAMKMDVAFVTTSPGFHVTEDGKVVAICVCRRAACSGDRDTHSNTIT